MSDAIRVVCDSCGKGIKAPDKYAGKTVNCPGCQASLVIPHRVDKLPPPVPTRVAESPKLRGGRAFTVKFICLAGLASFAVGSALTAAALHWRMSEAESRFASESRKAREDSVKIVTEAKSRIEELEAFAKQAADTARVNIARDKKLGEIYKEDMLSMQRMHYFKVAQELTNLTRSTSKNVRRRLVGLTEMQSIKLTLALTRIGMGAGTDFDADTVEDLLGEIHLVTMYRQDEIPKASEEWIEKCDPSEKIRRWPQSLGLVDESGFPEIKF